MKVLSAGDGALIYSKDLETIQKVNTRTHLGLDSELAFNRDSSEW